MKQILFKLIEEQNINELKLFIKKNENFNFNFTDEYGNNLLHFAANKLTENTLYLIQLLLENGVDPLSVNEKFETPLDYAKKNNNIPALTIMKHFINKKINEEKNYY